MFEGAPSEGVHLHGHKLGNKIVLQGNWVEHLIEHPSNKEIVETHLVKIRGLITSELFDGKLNIEGVETDQNIRLKRVKRLWMCKP